MKIGALVPARLGSKRLKKKNIKMLEGRPLICWTLDVLLDSEVFSDITVSTESDEVTDVVRQFYSEQDVGILKRPEALAGDDALLTEVRRHYLDHRPQMEWSGLVHAHLSLPERGENPGSVQPDTHPLSLAGGIHDFPRNGQHGLLLSRGNRG